MKTFSMILFCFVLVPYSLQVSAKEEASENEMAPGVFKPFRDEVCRLNTGDGILARQSDEFSKICKAAKDRIDLQDSILTWSSKCKMDHRNLAYDTYKREKREIPVEDELRIQIESANICDGQASKVEDIQYCVHEKIQGNHDGNDLNKVNKHLSKCIELWNTRKLVKQLRPQPTAEARAKARRAPALPPPPSGAADQSAK